MPHSNHIGFANRVSERHTTCGMDSDSSSVSSSSKASDRVGPLIGGWYLLVKERSEKDKRLFTGFLIRRVYYQIAVKKYMLDTISIGRSLIPPVSKPHQ